MFGQHLWEQRGVSRPPLEGTVGELFDGSHAYGEVALRPVSSDARVGGEAQCGGVADSRTPRSATRVASITVAIPTSSQTRYRTGTPVPPALRMG